MQTQIIQPQIQWPKELEPYLKEFEQIPRDPQHPSWLFPVRKAALARFAELGFPTIEQEDWRFTNLAPMLKLPFRPQFKAAPAGLSRSDLDRFGFQGLTPDCLVFVDGHYAPELSTPPAGSAMGVLVTNMASALATHPGLLEKYLPRSARADQNAFATLNTAFFQDGVFIFVPAGQVQEPVQLLFIQMASEPGATSHPRNLIVTEADAKLTVLESYVSLVNAPCLTNTVTDFIIGDGSVVEHVKLQDESAGSFHLATLPITLGANVNFISHSIAVGAKLSRNNISTLLDGEGAECILNGLYITRDEQLADHWMRVEHAKAHCNSHEYFNGILEDRSKGVFHGRILVRPEAQKTDAKQTNKNLLLSEQATIDTKPQLEIYADDVKCTHGATVGQLNDESIFYLRARGLGLDTARRILIHAFAGEILERIRWEAARTHLDQRIWDRLEQNAGLATQK